uniref:3'-5' exonuclease domain-containing protein n=1 Tax=Syphacia muris TaxID=451379 RepID=A0A158R539_9BILA
MEKHVDEDEEFSDEASLASDATVSKCEKKKLAKAEARQLCRLSPLREPFLSWQTTFEDIWFSDDPKEIRRKNVEDALGNIFEWVIDPYDIILGIYSTCFDYGARKPNSFSSCVVNYGKVWLGQCDREKKYSKYLTLKRKQDAFTIATTKGIGNLNIFVDIYQLFCDEIVEEAFAKVEEMIDCGKISDALECAMQFQLQSRIKLDKLIVPAVLQGQMQRVKVYLDGYKDLQQQLAVYFDALILLRDKEIVNYFDGLLKHKITVPNTSFQRKSLERMVAKICQLFNLPSSIAPNMLRSRIEGELRYITGQHFAGVISKEAYLDYVIHALSVKPELRKFFVAFLLRHFKDVQEALRWVTYFNMYDNIPAHLFQYLTEENIDSARQSMTGIYMKCEILGILSVDCFRLLGLRKSINDPIYLFDGHPIIIIDEVDGLMKVAESVSNADVVGIDTEYKPRFISLNEEVALMQVSLYNCSYLIDIITLEKNVTDEQWTKFFEGVFYSENTIKLGFDFANDLRALMLSFSPISLRTRNMICIMRLAKSVLQEFPYFFSSFKTLQTDGDENNSQTNNTVHFGLTDLCKEVLGNSLDKSEQFSDWAVRPLRLKQMRYAANDAYCLLQIYRKLKERVMQLLFFVVSLILFHNVLNPGSWEVHMEKANMNYKPNKQKKPKVKSKKICIDDIKSMIERINISVDSKELTSKGRARRPKDLKLIVDSMILGLGKHLRRCGVDTLLADSKESLMKYALEDADRFILTSGKSYNNLMSNRKLRDHDRIICLTSQQSLDAIQQVEQVFKLFNITLKEEDIFSRCMKCNSADLLQAPSIFLETMCFCSRCKLSPEAEKDEFADYINKLLSVKSDWTFHVSNDSSVSELIATSSKNRLDIVSCIAYTQNNIDGVTVRVEDVPPNAYEKEDRIFYICGSCGVIYWDGYQKRNYNIFADPLLKESFVAE